MALLILAFSWYATIVNSLLFCSKFKDPSEYYESLFLNPSVCQTIHLTFKTSNTTSSSEFVKVLGDGPEAIYIDNTYGHNTYVRAFTEIDIQQFSSFKDMKKMEIRNYNFTTFPSEITTLTTLQVLKVYDSEIKQLPSSIGDLTNLIMLWLYNNKLSELPESFGNLSNLILLFDNTISIF